MRKNHINNIFNRLIKKESDFFKILNKQWDKYLDLDIDTKIYEFVCKNNFL